VSGTAREQGRLLRWINRKTEIAWGSDPGAFRPELVEATLIEVARFIGPGKYFRIDVKGFENVPARASMVVSNHSGGTTIPDVWGFLSAWYRHFGVGRPIHPLAHELILSTELTGRYFAERGVLRAGKAIGREVLERFGRDLMVMPGGDMDTWRPYSKRYQVRFGGRSGYARLALQTGVPIVPVANAGAHETLIVLTDGQKIAEALRLPSIFRARIFPVHLSLPWGLAVGPWPHLPLPARLRYRIGPPVEPPEQIAPGEEPPEDLVAEYDRRVQAAVQRLLDQLSRDRVK
jgi:1-acyl-sn-glycerol-3-phosphate acyltransferase